MVRNVLWLFAASVFLLASCNRKMGSSMQNKSEAELRQLAKELAHQYIITDGHVDLPSRLRVRNFQLTREYMSIPIQSDEGDFDYMRAKEGGLDAPFMSIYIPATLQTNGRAKTYADSLIDLVALMPKAHPDKFAMAYSPKDVEENFKRGLISLPLGMENGAPVMDDLANVAYWHKRGIRYITLTHSKDNQICDSSYDSTRTWNGLSAFGRDVVREMNRVGIMVDISHVSDSTFYQVLRITKAPVIASHSSCRVFTPGFERNMNDDMIRALARNGGVIQINFGSSFLDGKVQENQNQNRAKLAALLEEKGLKWNEEAAKPVIEQFRKENPTLYSDVEKVADHIDHVVKLAGIEYVGLGSDYDGVGDSLPVGLKDVSQYPNLLYELLKRGYSPEDIEKICYKNVFRVWRAVEKTAQEWGRKS